MRTVITVFILIFLFGASGSGQSQNGAGGIASGYGKVDFANTGSTEAQGDLLTGLALLHDFEYDLAAAAFRRAEAKDPTFVMAYWGEAMTFNHPIWMQQDLNAARAALAKLAPTTEARLQKAKSPRERDYLAAVEILYGEGTKFERDFRYAEAMANLHAKYPNDVDATAFYGLAILGTAHAGRDVPTYMRAAGILEEAWADHQEHPGLVHYLIHSYDDPTHAPLGLRAARIYSRIAPNAGHAQHMTSHIFVALGMWNEVVQANIAAIAVVNELRKASGKVPAGCGHYPTWLNYGYLQIDQPAKARSAVAACRAEVDARMALSTADAGIIGSYAEMRLRYLLDTGTLPDEMASWKPPESGGARARLDHEFARTWNELRQGRRAEAAQALTDLEPAAKAVVDLETKAADPDPTFRVRPQILLLEARALLAELDGDQGKAEAGLIQAVELEEKLPMAFGPPMIDKPTHELYGEFLLRRGRKQDAIVEYKKALARTPGRRLTERGLAESSGSTLATAK